MVAATERPRQTVLAIVKSKAEAKDGYKIELEIPAFESQYPTTVTRVAEAVASRLKLEQQYPLVLERQNLKTGKTGAKPYDYYWGIVKIADVQDVAETWDGSEEGSPLAHQPSQSNTRERSIERQVAAKLAVELALHMVETPSTEDIILVAYKFAQFMATGRLQFPPDGPAETGQAQVPLTPVPVAPATFDKKPQPQTTAKFLSDATSFWTWVRGEDETRESIEHLLGCTVPQWLEANPTLTHEDLRVFIVANRPPKKEAR